MLGYLGKACVCSAVCQYLPSSLQGKCVLGLKLKDRCCVAPPAPVLRVSDASLHLLKF
jgi:hypothetical protein